MRRLALLLLIACGDEKTAFLTVFNPCESLSLEPAADGTEMQQNSVADAIEMWNAVANTRLTLEPGGRSLPIVFEESYLFLGFYDDEAEVIRLAHRVNEQRPLAVVLAHELGHAFNLFHVNDRDSVMNEGNSTIAPQDSDARALESQWGTCVSR